MVVGATFALVVVVGAVVARVVRGPMVARVVGVVDVFGIG